MSASDMASKLSGMSFAFGLRTQFAELVKRTKDQMDESEESEQPPSEETAESATTEEKQEATASPASPEQQAAEKAEPTGDNISQHKSPEEKPRSVRDMIARFQGGDSGGSSPRKSRPKEPSKPSPEPPAKDKQREVVKKEGEKPKEEKIATKAGVTAVASKPPATEQTSTVGSKPTEHVEQASEKPAMNLVTRAIRGIEQKAETVLNKQKDTPVVVPVTKEKEVAPVVTESKPKEAPPVEPSNSKTEKQTEPVEETSTVEVRGKDPDIAKPVQKVPAHRKQRSVEKQTRQERNQEVKKETPVALVSQESPPVQQVQADQPPPSEDQGKGAVPQKAPPEAGKGGKAEVPSHLAVRKAKKIIPRDRSSSYDPESDHSGDGTSSDEGPASRAGSVIMSSPEPSPDEEEMGCKTFMEMFVSNVFNGSPVGPDEQSHFGEMCRKPAGRKWFARQVNSERCNTKCVSETTFYRLVQCFAIALFECGEADDFIPAKILMNMCFTFYYEDQPEPGKEQKVFLYMYLKDQPVWKSIRFWNAAFFESVQHERTQRGAPSTREGWRSLSSEERQDSHKANENITFGQLGTFTSNMVAFGLSKDLILEFLRKQSIIGNLSSDQYDMLKEHVEKEEVIRQSQPENPHSPAPTPSPVAETPPAPADKESPQRERNNSGSKMLTAGLSSLRKISTSLKTWKTSNGNKEKEKE
ncbi:neurofilament heavy polypeptide-like isoform X2 [Branchiostoma floridae]|uniref:Neurofilament heavy polypeptide-like isoform X2 n=1 Tax=Branchiostoma floridae TaxID=7739 RepID=A0A9J7MUE5_BRAFL|nr:neurofilament heavy polypeptide-like isoform X2 [Branchiostoma floridae]